jgi:putative transposase
MNQLAFRLPTWGGKRRGAGRKPKGKNAAVSRLRREEFPARHPVHVTLRTLFGVGYLRGWKLFQAIQGAIRESQERFGMRVVHFSVQGNHLHLVVEAEDERALARGMQALGVRIAKALNRLMGRKGAVFADHYHARILRSPTQVANALAYVLLNFLHHFPEEARRFPGDARDPFSSAWREQGTDPHVVAARTWLLSVGWRFRSAEVLLRIAD